MCAVDRREPWCGQTHLMQLKDTFQAKERIVYVVDVFNVLQISSTCSPSHHNPRLDSTCEGAQHFSFLIGLLEPALEIPGFCWDSADPCAMQSSGPLSVLLIGKKSDSVCCQTKSIKTGWQMRRWRQSFGVSRREKKVEVAMHRRQVMAAWRPCGSNLSPWRTNGRETYVQRLQGKSEQHKGRCQEEKKDEGIVKMSKSKAEPVSSWCHSRQAVSMKLHQRAVWNLTFLVYGVYLVKAEVQEDHAREIKRSPGRGMRKGTMMWETWCRKPKRNKSSPGKDPRTLVENSNGGNVSTYQINSQGKDPRTIEAPVQGGGFRKKRKKKWKKRKRKKKKSEAQKKSLVDKSAKNNLRTSLCQKRTKKIWRNEGRERYNTPRTKQFLGRSGTWRFLLLILMQNWFCADAAAGRLEPKGKAEVPEIMIVSDAVEGTFVNLEGESLQEEQKGK